MYIYIYIYILYPRALRATPPPCQGSSMVELQKLLFGVVPRGGAPANFYFLLVRGPTNSIEKVAKICENRAEIEGKFWKLCFDYQNERIWVENGAEIVENETKWALVGPKSDVEMILC